MDTAEIIAEMRANPALAQELRSVLLSNELLELPQRVAEMDARLTARLDALAERVAEMDARLTARLDALAERVAEMDARLTARLDALAERLDRVVDRADRQERDMGALKGMGMERKVVNSLRGVLRGVVERPRPLDPTAVDELIDQAVASGMPDWEAAELALSDVIARGRSVEDGGDVLAVMEVSWRLEDKDLSRVLRRAAVVARAGGRPLGVVVDYDDPTDRDLLASLAAAGIKRVSLREDISAA